MKNLFIKILFTFYLILSSKQVEALPLSIQKVSDSSIVKVFYGGSIATVPDKKLWVIQKVFLSSNDGYNIQINPANFKKEYQSGEKIVFPLYIADMELLDKKDMISYLVYIDEK